MRYSTAGGSGWKIPPPAKDDVCYWNINTQLWRWKTAEIQVTFTKIEPGIKLALWSNDGLAIDEPTSDTLIKQLIPDNTDVQQDQVYTIDAKKYNFTIIAVPIAGSSSTAFEFTF